ncbi:TIGR02678 family protein [Nakamurella sp. YIM 132087]|uniref:TIGR02678 family protein n=1 Tax=Nakamurella alba TaxID=2665158 RepID=A0A7K1FLW6_9ACTN|nr:TIGR02678 family protein [Nakamurella alba]MTD15142.1 TIGR02678 family protein [Nakamurella alba]
MIAPAVSTLTQDAVGRRQAARYLLAEPILTATRRPDQLALVRRHATALRSMFSQQLGYTLVVESGFARLVKAPPGSEAPLRPGTRESDGTAFGPAGYAILALVCAGLLAPGIGDQILISGLVAQVRADAAEQGITVSDNLADRRQLVMAIGLLISWGVLTETDGSVTGWGERREEEALLSIHRPLLALVVPHALPRTDDPADIWNQPADDQPRRRLRRRLVENPAVFRSELPEDERDVLSRERTELARQLAENFGLTLEVRAEGALAYDPAGELSDIDFPGTGSAKQAALLLLDELIIRLEPGPDSMVNDRPGLLAPWSTVDAVLSELAVRHAKTWRFAYAGDPELLRRDVVGVLVSLRLASSEETGLVVFPFAARFRPRVIRR